MSKFYIRVYKNGKRIRTQGTNSKKDNGIVAKEIIDDIIQGELPGYHIPYCSCNEINASVDSDVYVIDLVNNRRGNKIVYHVTNIRYFQGPIKTSYTIEHYNWNGKERHPIFDDNKTVALGEFSCATTLEKVYAEEIIKATDEDIKRMIDVNTSISEAINAKVIENLNRRKKRYQL